MNVLNFSRYCNNLSSAKFSHSFKNTIYYYAHKKPGSYFLSTVTESKKTPLLEKWKKYWQDLVTDYYEVLKETIEDGKKNPKRSAFLFTCTAIAYTCFKANPNEIDFRENIINCCNEVLLVGKPTRNKKSEEFLTSVETFYNFGVIRRLSFGLFSVMWIDNFSSELGIYKAHCPYLKPQYLTFYDRVIDFGFFGRWWKLDSVMKDYDVNEEEWVDSEKNK